MAKRMTKEQRQSAEIEDLRKQLSMIYSGITTDDWLSKPDETFLTPSTLGYVLRVIQVVFEIPDGHRCLRIWHLESYENPSDAAAYLHAHGIRAWTKLAKGEGT